MDPYYVVSFQKQALIGLVLKLKTYLFRKFSITGEKADLWSVDG